MIISFVGDVSLDSIDAKKNILADEIVNIFKSSDILVGNLENPVTESNCQRDFLPVPLKTGEKSIEVLKHFTILNLANNHIFDFGLDGFNDTRDFLEKNNILYLGAGINEHEANLPLQVVGNNACKIAVLSGTRWCNAGANKPGTSLFQESAKKIMALKEKGFFIVYYPHWGYEFVLLPPPDVRKHAKKMIDLGVDLIVGTHPHVIQGFEKYKGKLIFYSIGNFIFHDKIMRKLAPEAIQNKVKTSMIVKFNIKANQVDEYMFYPTTFSNERVRLLTGPEKESAIAEIHANSEVFAKSHSRYLQEYCKQIPGIVKQNKKIRMDFQNYEKQSLKKKFLLFSDVNKQDVWNRLFCLTLIKK